MDDKKSLEGLEQAVLSVAQAIFGQYRDPTVISPDVGDMKWRPMNSAFNDWIIADGSAVSRTTYADLFNYLNPSKGTFTVTIATPAVFTLVGHGMLTGDQVYLTTTGALPTGLSANTLYYLIKSTADVFWLATSRANAIAGTKIATSGTQSGVHTIRLCPYGLGDGSTTFNVPNPKGKVLVGVDTGDNNFLAAGQTGGASTHTLTIAEMPSHTHTQNAHGHNATNNAYNNSDTPTGGGQNGVRLNATANQNLSVTVANTTATNQNTGGDGAHNNLQPYLTGYWFIKT